MKPLRCGMDLLLLFCLSGGPALGAPASLRTERFGLVACAAEPFVYVAGGYSDHGVVNTLEIFNARADQPEFLDVTVLPRFFHAGAMHGGRLYLAGGLTPAPGDEDGIMLRHAGEFEEFDPAAKAVRRLPDLPVAVSRPGAAVVGDRLYLIGGSTESGERTAAVQIYDFNAGQWSRGADLPVAREGAVMAWEGKIYAPGGYDGITALRDFQIYDPAADRWEKLPELPVKMSAHNGVAADGQIYTFGDYEILGRTAAYDIRKQTWSLLNLQYQPSRHQGAAVLDGDVFVAGGNVSSWPPYLATIQRFPLGELAAAARQEWKTGVEKPVAVVPPGAGLETFSLCGQPAPAIEMQLVDGKTWRLADQTGRVVVLDFWSTGCGPCRRALPELAALAKEFADQDVVFAGIGLDPASCKDKIADLAKENGTPYAMGFGAAQAGRTYEVRAIPCLVVVDRAGVVRGRLVGFSAAGQEVLRQSLRRLLDNQSPPLAVRPGASREARIESGSSCRRALPPAPVPDPRFFRLKWKQATGAAPARTGPREWLEYRLAPRYLVLNLEKSLGIFNAADGALVKTVPLPPEALQQEEWGGPSSFVYLRNGETGLLLGCKTVYEATAMENGGRSIRSVGLQWLALAEDGSLLWVRDGEPEQGSTTGLQALPAGENRDLVFVYLWNRFQILDGRGRTIVDQKLGASNERWLFRAAADGAGIEALVIGQDIACYDVVFPPAAPLNPEFFQKKWSRPAGAAEILNLTTGRLNVQLQPRFVTLRKTDQLSVVGAEDGKTVAEIPLSSDWQDRAAAVEFAYLRTEAGGLAAALKTRAAAAPGEPATITLAGLGTDGREMWKTEWQEPAGTARIFALPAGRDRDLLLVELWNRLLFINADGRILLEQPLGSTGDPLLLRSAENGEAFEIIEAGAELAGYRWQPAP